MKAPAILTALILLATTVLCVLSASDVLQDDDTATVFDPIADKIGNLKGQINKFFSEKVFNQQEVSGDDDDDSGEIFPHLAEQEKGDPLFQGTIEKIGQFVKDFGLIDFSNQGDHKKFDDVFGRVANANKEPTRSYTEMKDLFLGFVKESIAHWANHFKDVNFDNFNPVSLLYYVEHLDEVKNPSWKRRKHRFHKQVPMDSIVELHSALYLSQLSYAGNLKIIKEGMQDFLNGTYELIYADIEGLPGEPANFMAIHKKSNSRKLTYALNPMGFEYPIEEPLQVLLVVRGTKELGDMLSDTLIDAADFKGGKSHKGLQTAGKYIVSQHLERLRHLLDASSRKTIKLGLVGHSLGAGAAAIAAMLFNEHDWIDASSIGFGCPALLDLPQSVAVKDYVITVVTDSDIVPRMSGAVMVNSALDLMAYDWTAKGLEDLDLTLDWLALPNKAKIVSWANGIMDTYSRPFFKEVQLDRVEQVLYPPGNCIHVFRDGVGFSATYTPCSFFDSIDISRTMVDDHLIDTGYHKSFVNLLRDYRKDLNADFQHNLMALDV